MTAPSPMENATTKVDPDTAKRALLVLGSGLQLVMMAGGLWPATWLVRRYAPAADTPGHWVLLILAAVLVFNYGYLAALLVFRWIIPPAKQGHHVIGPDGRLPRAVWTWRLNLLLHEARFDPPWAAMFSSVLTRVPPLGPLFRRSFGPRTPSVTMGDAMNCLGPRLLEVGKNVEFGFDATVAVHHFDGRQMYIRKVVIGEHAVIGGKSMLMPGVEVGHHAVVGSMSVVPPDTKIPPYEYWAGAPAKKTKHLRPDGDPEEDERRDR